MEKNVDQHVSFIPVVSCREEMGIEVCHENAMRLNLTFASVEGPPLLRHTSTLPTGIHFRLNTRNLPSIVPAEAP